MTDEAMTPSSTLRRRPSAKMLTLVMTMRKLCKIPLQILLYSSLVFTLQACTTAQSTIAHGQGSTISINAADSASAHHAATAFLSALDSLKFEPFRDYLAEDVTMFVPLPQFPSRLEGRDTVATVFGNFMRAQRASRERDGRPMAQGLEPRDLRIQMLGSAAAVVSFYLGAEAPSRRSIVFQKGATGWKVAHWHASPTPASSQK